jgi:heat shock protein HslJ
MKKFHLITFLLLLLTSCNTEKKDKAANFELPESTTDIDGKKKHDLTGIFTLQKVNDTLFDITEYYGREATQPYLTFDTTTQKISGHTGCNAFVVGYQIKDSNIVLDDELTSTTQACEKGSVWEIDLLEVLRTENIAINKNRLLVKSDKMKLLYIRK